MALTFGAATSDRVDHGKASSLNDISTVTFAIWFYPTTLTSGKRLFEKTQSAGSRRVFIHTTTSELRWQNGQSTTNADYITSNASITTNKWWFAAFTYNGSGTGREKIYVGDLSTLATERTYSTSSDGSGTYNADNANNLMVGNANGANAALQGRIAVFVFWNRVLSLGEIQSFQFRPRRLGSGCVLFAHYGFNGTGTQPDWSGSGNSGTVTGATLTPDHVPLGPPFFNGSAWRGAFTATAPAASGGAYRLLLGVGA